MFGVLPMATSAGAAGGQHAVGMAGVIGRDRFQLLFWLFIRAAVLVLVRRRFPLKPRTRNKQWREREHADVSPF
ncbi:hypothetical protein ACNKHX_15195 [Shigella flexneri]